MTVALLVMAATLSLAPSAAAQSPGAGACDEYTASLCGSSGPGGGGASGGGQAAGGGLAADGAARGPMAVGGASELRLPLLGYPVTPLVAALAALAALAFLVRAGIAVHRWRGEANARFGA